MSNANPWVLLIGGILLGWLTGWLLELLFFRRTAAGAAGEQVDVLTAELAGCREEVDALRAAATRGPAADTLAYEAQIGALRGQVAALESELTVARAAPAAAAAFVVPAAAGAALLAELSTEPSDLEALEGIGPVMASRLQLAGVTNYDRLARLTPAWLDDMLRVPAWRRPDYEAWIEQARLASAGDTRGLKLLQDQLYARKGDNLALIHGIGPATAEALRVAGITTFVSLAATDPERLGAIADEAGVVDADVNAWIEEAGLRAAGKRIARSPHLRATAVLVSCPQDLSRVSGIGPVLETRLYDAGIGTFWELANLDDVELARILDSEKVHNLSLGTIRNSAARLAEETGTMGRAWDGTPPDDLEQLAGIGEEYERRLVESGVCTFRALASLSVAELAAIIKPDSNSHPDFDAWIAEAQKRTE